LGNISQSAPSVSASLKTSRENPRQPVNAGLGVERAEKFGLWSIPSVTVRRADGIYESCDGSGSPETNPMVAGASSLPTP
jgi:hypothetical protein